MPSQHPLSLSLHHHHHSSKDSSHQAMTIVSAATYDATRLRQGIVGLPGGSIILPARRDAGGAEAEASNREVNTCR
ncbi:hypothetical protein E2C01_080638 [Portunus trituberculatus]|uniref:Uncharacterized protein n=1 Tax=Portunus trituberculatus TaxID=210409 RepID=A0A5B7IMQ5_PORTR|nr:hypothetical protein [Portunus trituberculatus]